MLVKDLIAKLTTLDQNREICFFDYDKGGALPIECIYSVIIDKNGYIDKFACPNNQNKEVYIIQD